MHHQVRDCDHGCLSCLVACMWCLSIVPATCRSWPSYKVCHQEFAQCLGTVLASQGLFRQAVLGSSTTEPRCIILLYPTVSNHLHPEEVLDPLRDSDLDDEETIVTEALGYSRDSIRASRHKHRSLVMAEVHVAGMLENKRHISRALGWLV